MIEHIYWIEKTRNNKFDTCQFYISKEKKGRMFQQFLATAPIPITEIWFISRAKEFEKFDQGVLLRKRPSPPFQLASSNWLLGRTRRILSANRIKPRETSRRGTGGEWKGEDPKEKRDDAKEAHT